MSGTAPSLPVARSVADLRIHTGAWRKQGLSVGVVPTMGALHDGHLSLVRAALKECGRVVATIFVNPTQFGPNDDLAAYPRPEAADAAKLAGIGAHLLFAPSAGEMYPEGHVATVSVGGSLTQGLCAPFRPGHFQGVATVVAKLFLQTQADRAYFGEKDWQQLQVVKRMARDLDIPIEVVGVPTVREADGLAMSSRNAYLDPARRKIASVLPRALIDAAARIASGAAAAAELDMALRRLLEAGFESVDYVSLCDGTTLAPLDRAMPGARIFVAARLGGTRLIDNMELPAHLAA